MVTPLTVLSLIGGIVDLKYADRIKPLKNIHSNLLLLTLTMAFICLVIAFAQPFYSREFLFILLTMTCTILAMVGIFISAKLKNVQTWADVKKWQTWVRSAWPWL